MKRTLLIAIGCILTSAVWAQIDPELLRRIPVKNDSLQMNMDAVYNRPFLQVGKLPVAIGGYAEANYQYLSDNGVSEGSQFQMRRLTLFLSSSLSRRIKFLTEIEHSTKTTTVPNGSL